MSVSTHSRPKAAGHSVWRYPLFEPVSTHSRPKAAGRLTAECKGVERFQHTAARRRLGAEMWKAARDWLFQHTAARRRLVVRTSIDKKSMWFQHTAARRRLGKKRHAV